AIPSFFARSFSLRARKKRKSAASEKIAKTKTQESSIIGSARSREHEGILHAYDAAAPRPRKLEVGDQADDALLEGRVLDRRRREIRIFHLSLSADRELHRDHAGEPGRLDQRFEIAGMDVFGLRLD